MKLFDHLPTWSASMPASTRLVKGVVSYSTPQLHREQGIIWNALLTKSLWWVARMNSWCRTPRRSCGEERGRQQYGHVRMRHGGLEPHTAAARLECAPLHCLLPDDAGGMPADAWSWPSPVPLAGQPPWLHMIQQPNRKQRSPVPLAGEPLSAVDLAARAGVLAHAVGKAGVKLALVPGRRGMQATGSSMSIG